MTRQVDEMVRLVSHRVAGGRPVKVHPQVEVEARGLTIEFDPEPYPEVRAAFDEYCRVRGVSASLFGYSVRPVVDVDEPMARVTATLGTEQGTLVGEGVGADVLSGSVQAFTAAFAG